MARQPFQKLKFALALVSALRSLLTPDDPGSNPFIGYVIKHFAKKITEKMLGMIPQKYFPCHLCAS